jgi:hypothetical protein
MQKSKERTRIICDYSFSNVVNTVVPLFIISFLFKHKLNSSNAFLLYYILVTGILLLASVIHIQKFSALLILRCHCDARISSASPTLKDYKATRHGQPLGK